MTDQDRQFDEYGRGMPRPCEPVSDRFRKDLRALCQPTGSVPPQVDRAILDQAHRRLGKPRRIIRIRWAGGIAAAAAMIALGVFLYHGPASDNHPSSTIHHPSVAAERRIDFDGNGRVDILDAFRLAKQIESGSQTPSVAFGVPSRGPAAVDWDINNDGRVDREDVDAVAFAAVRLRPVSVGCIPHRLPQSGGRFFVGWASPPDTFGRAGTLVLQRDEPRRTAQSDSSCATRQMSIAAVLPESPTRHFAFRGALDKGV